MSQKKSFYSFEEAAQFLNITLEEVEKFIADKELKFYKLSGSKKIKHGDLSRLQEQHPEFKERKVASNDYHSFSDVLKILQLENQELERLVNDGSIKVALVDGQVKFSKEVVETFRQEKMVEPTIMVEESDDDDLLAEDEDDIFT